MPVLHSADPEADTRPAPDANSAIVSARGLTRIYRMGEVDVVALRGATLELMQGELLVGM